MERRGIKASVVEKTAGVGLAVSMAFGPVAVARGSGEPQSPVTSETQSEQNQQEGPQPVPVLSERLRVNFEGDVRENPAVQAITQVYSEALKNVILESPQYSGTNITDYEMAFGRNGDGLITGVLVNNRESLAFIVNPFSPVIEPVILVEGAEVSFAQVEGFIGVHPVVRFPDNQVAVLGQVEGEGGLTGMPLPEGTLVTMVDTFTSPILPQGRVNAPSGLNLREGASTNDTRIGLLENGTSFGVIGETNGWLNIVLSNGQRGWVFKDLTITPQPTQVPTPRLLIETLATPSTPEPSGGVEIVVDLATPLTQEQLEQYDLTSGLEFEINGHSVIVGTDFPTNMVEFRDADVPRVKEIMEFLGIEVTEDSVVRIRRNENGRPVTLAFGIDFFDLNPNIQLDSAGGDALVFRRRPMLQEDGDTLLYEVFLSDQIIRDFNEVRHFPNIGGGIDVNIAERKFQDAFFGAFLAPGRDTQFILSILSDKILKDPAADPAERLLVYVNTFNLDLA